MENAFLIAETDSTLSLSLQLNLLADLAIKDVASATAPWPALNVTRASSIN
jgi:hypothetical protein